MALCISGATFFTAFGTSKFVHRVVANVISHRKNKEDGIHIFELQALPVENYSVDQWRSSIGEGDSDVDVTNGPGYDEGDDLSNVPESQALQGSKGANSGQGDDLE